MVRPQELAHLFCSNSTPEPTEASSIKLNIENLLSKKSQLQELEDDLLSKISLVKSQLRELEDDLRQHYAILSPLRRMPLEILSNIFELAVPTQMMGAPGRSRVTNLCLVSKSWCLAARLTRPLWSSVNIDIDVYTGGLSFEKVATWLGRAGDIPKSITYREMHETSLPDPQFVKLLAQGPPLDHLSMSFDNPLSFQKLLHSLESFEMQASSPRSWDSIRSMTFDFKHGWDSSPIPERNPPSVFNQIPSSVTSFQLAITTQPLSDVPPHVNAILHLPKGFLERLNSFSIRCDWDAIQIPSAVQHCVNVQFLTIDFCRRVTHWPNGEALAGAMGLPPSGLRFPRLHTLCLAGASYSSCAPLLFPLLMAPSLITLRLHHASARLGHTISKQLRSLADQRQPEEACAIRHLIVGNMDATIQRFTDFLLGFPILTHLKLQSVCLLDPGDIFKILHDTSLIPKLETLEMFDMRPKDVDLQLLPTLLKLRSRSQSGSDTEISLTRSSGYLRSIVLTYPVGSTPEPPDEDLAQQIRTLARLGGVVINIDFTIF